MSHDGHPQIEKLARENARLREQLAKEALARDELARQVTTKQRTIEQLEERLQRLLRRLFGRRSEKLDPGQLLLPGLEDKDEPKPPHVDEAPDDEAAVQEPKARRRRRSRKAKLEDLPHVRVEHDVDPKDKRCACGREKHKIGEEKRNEIEYVPASVFVKVHVRPKYACRACEDGVVIAPLPSLLIDRGLPGPGLLAQIVTSKYHDHLPLYRQEAIFERHGLPLSRKTMCDWIGVVYELLLPILLAMRRELLARKVVQSDDTPVLVQVKGGAGGCARAFLWIYVAAEDDLVVYDFSLTRGREAPKAFLEGFSGDVLQRDGYAAYNGAVLPHVVLAACWAHARRKVHECLGTHPLEASELLALIQMLYLVERRAKELGLDPAARLELRQQETLPLLAEIERVLERLRATVLPASDLGKALAYIANQWHGLTRFAHDGRIPIDNNSPERGMKRVAVGRKNWLFCGSEEGGERAAGLYSLIETCRRIGVEPFEYLRDVLSRVSTHPARLVHELTPAGWKAAREAAGARANVAITTRS